MVTLVSERCDILKSAQGMAFEMRDSYAMGIDNVVFTFSAKKIYITKVNFCALWK